MLNTNTSSSYDFFCRDWPDPPVSRLSRLSKSGVVGETFDEPAHSTASFHEDLSAASSQQDEEKSSSADTSDKTLLVTSSDGRDICAVVAPVYVSQHVRYKQYEDSCCFVDQYNSLEKSLEEGLSRPVMQSNRAEDGLYEGPKPFVSSLNYKRMIARLALNGNPMRWSTNGDELLCEAPVDDSLYRRHCSLSDDYLQTRPVHFVPASTENCREWQEFAKSSTSECSLRLLLQTLHFNHSPLMAAEQVLASRLAAAATQYTKRVLSRQTELLSEKLKVIRNSLAKLEEEYRVSSRSSSSKTRVLDELDYKRRSEVYRKSLQVTRDEMHASGRTDRKLLTEALTAWSQLEELRESQGYCVTAIHLLVTETQSSLEVEDESLLWREAVEAEVKELRYEKQLEYDEALAQYRSKLHNWRRLRSQRREARQRLQGVVDTTIVHNGDDGKAESTDQQALQAATDQLVLETPVPQRPQPPSEPDGVQQVRQQIEELYRSSTRAPGEPVVRLKLTEDKEFVTPPEQLPLQERRRRQAISRTAYAVKVFVNNKLVTQTPWRCLDELQFSVSFQYSLQACLTDLPQNVTLKLLQSTSSLPVSPVPLSTGLGTALRHSKTIAVTRLPLEAGLPVPTTGVMTSSASTTCMHLFISFSNTETICFSHAGVGAAITGSKLGGADTSAVLTLRYALSADSSLTETKHQLILGRAVSRNSEGDPNDPVNAKLRNKYKNAVSRADHVKNSITAVEDNVAQPGDVDEEEGYFECSGESVGPSWFCTEKDLDSNVRLKLLSLRDRKVPEFQDLQRIPALSSQILRSTVWNYEMKYPSVSTFHEEDSNEVEGSTRGEVITGGDSLVDDDDWLDDVAERLLAAERLVSSVRRRLLQQTAEAAAVPTPSDMVQEEQIPDISTLGTSLVALLRPKRPLKPERNLRGALRGPGLTGRQVKLLVYVARAYNVPTRTSDSGNASEGGTLVRSFVTVCFQGKRARTNGAEGPNPTWNQQLILPFRAPNDDYSGSSLGLVRENIVLQLMDERLLLVSDEAACRSEEEDATFNRTEQASHGLHTRLHHTWLASLTIPTTALLHHTSKIEGTFELSSPVSVLGYQRRSDNAASACTQLTLYITLEPALSHPAPLQGLHPCHEPAKVVAAAKSWRDSLSSRHPERHFECHVLSLAGHLVALNRFIRPLPPPPHLQDIGVAAEEQQQRLAWYVSLLPVLPDMTLFPGTPNITANSEQLLNLLCGGESERAMLLTNYFLHMGYNAFLLVGNSVCHGRSSSVLVRSDAQWCIWCPDTAKVYSTRDPFCPVKAVYMLVNEVNVWGNCQSWEDPARVQFSVEESGCWRPLYSSNLSTSLVASYGAEGEEETRQRSVLPSLQPATLLYYDPSPHHGRELREKLMIIVRDAFMKWRPQHRTVWNRHACDLLRSAVRRLEAPRSAGRQPPPPSSALQRLHNSHSVCGVCFQQPWRGVGPLLAAVHSCDVHSCTLPAVEFALAVHAQPYPGRVTSVWVYVASLIRKQ